MSAACVAYTAIAGDYPIKRKDIRCFTGDALFHNPVMEAKRYKVLSHLFVQNEITVWVDGNIWPLAEPGAIAEALLGDADVAAFQHPYRKTVWQEFAELRIDPRFAIAYLHTQLLEQERTYRAVGLPAETPLFECNVLVRRNTAPVRRLMNAWWAEICRWQWRDQVSFPFALWTHPDVKVATVAGNARDHPLFRYVSQY